MLLSPIPTPVGCAVRNNSTFHDIFEGFISVCRAPGWPRGRWCNIPRCSPDRVATSRSLSDSHGNPPGWSFFLRNGDGWVLGVLVKRPDITRFWDIGWYARYRDIHWYSIIYITHQLMCKPSNFQEWGDNATQHVENKWEPKNEKKRCSKLGQDAEVHRILVGPRLLVAARIQAAGTTRPGGRREPTQVLCSWDSTWFNHFYGGYFGYLT